MKRETSFRKRFVDKISRLSSVWILSVQQVAIRGTPDLILCVNGYFVALELKRSSKAKVTELQMYNINKIRGCNGFGMIVFPENEVEVLEFLTNLSNNGVG